MLNTVLINLESFLVYYGSLSVFMGSVMEQIIAPIPSSLVVLGASFLTMKGTETSMATVQTMFLNIVVPAALGVTLGSLVYYGLTYKLGLPFVEKSGKYLGLSVEDIEKVEIKVKKSRYQSLFLFLARCIPVIPSIAISVFCGIIRYPLKNYMLITFLGAMIQATILSIVGWQFGNLYLSISEEISLIDNLILAILILIVVLFIIRKKLKK